MILHELQMQLKKAALARRWRQRPPVRVRGGSRRVQSDVLPPLVGRDAAADGRGGHSTRGRRVGEGQRGIERQIQMGPGGGCLLRSCRLPAIAIHRGSIPNQSINRSLYCPNGIEYGSPYNAK